MSTPHLDAAPGEIADTVLLPGDPLRAKHLAEQLLTEPCQINQRRNMLGYTGHYRGLRVSIMGSGMGIPSCAIYATELARSHEVRRIVRVGTCGGLGPDLALGDVLIAQAASTDSNFNRLHFGGHDLAASADFSLLRAVVQTAEAQQLPHRVGGVFSTDCFYDGDPELLQRMARHRILGIEMESAGLYGVALREGFAALSVLAVSDLLSCDQHLSGEARERGLVAMARLTLDALCV